MKTSRIIIASLCLAVLCCASRGQETIATLRTTKGKVYQDVKISKATDIELRIVHSAGFAVVPLGDLSPDLQQRFGYNAAAVQTEMSRRAAGQQEAAARIAEEKRRIAEDAAELARRTRQIDDVAKLRVNVRLRIAQAKVQGMTLGYASRVRPATYAERVDKSSLIPNGFVTEKQEDEPIVVTGIPDTFADGDVWSGALYPCGTYTYDTVGGSTKTVRKYATTPEEAARQK